MAHDFNNLLMVISNNLHLLRRVEPSLEGSRQLAAIGRAVTSGERLTRQLLAFARRQPLHPEVLSLQERLPILLALVAPTLGPRIEGQCSVHPDTPAVEVDAAELELAIINLAVNAKDAMPDGGRFRLSARRARPDESGLPGDFVEISVADTGTGIDAEVIERVFDPFFTTKPHGQGTGLGLSQVYGLCTQAGGTARIESTPGRGTEVKLYLPAAAVAQAAAPVAATTGEAALDCSVLLVEDNEDLAGVTSALLEGVGCRVHWASSGDAARDLDRARRGAFRRRRERHGDARQARRPRVRRVASRAPSRDAGGPDHRVRQPAARRVGAGLHRAGEAVPARRADRRRAQRVDSSARTRCGRRRAPRNFLKLACTPCTRAPEVKAIAVSAVLPLKG